MRELTNTTQCVRIARITLASLALVLLTTGCPPPDDGNGNQNTNDNGNANDNTNANDNGNANDNTNNNDNGTPDGTIAVQRNLSSGEFEVGRALSSDDTEYAFFGQKALNGIALSISQIDVITSQTQTAVRFILDDELRPATLLSEDDSGLSLVYDDDAATLVARYVDPVGLSTQQTFNFVLDSPAPAVPDFDNLCAYFGRTIEVMDQVLAGCSDGTVDNNFLCNGSLANASDAIANFCVFTTESTSSLAPGLGSGPGLSLPLGVFVSGDDSVAPGETLSLDATAVGGLPPYTFNWTQVSGPELTLTVSSSANRSNVTLTPMVENTYVLRVQVIDALINLSRFDFTFVVERNPDDLVVSVEQALSDTDPFEVDLQALVTGGTTPYNFQWSTFSAPEGQTVSFGSPTGSSTSASFSGGGIYLVDVLVSDDGGSTTTERVSINIVDPDSTLVATIVFPECGHDGAEGFDLQAGLELSTDVLTPGDEVTTTVRVRNLGDADATDVTLRLTYDSQYEFVSAGGSPDSDSDGLITWDPEDLAAGATRTETVVLRLPSDADTEECLLQTLRLTNGDPEDDTNPDNDTFSVTQAVDLEDDDQHPLCDADCPLPTTAENTCVLLQESIDLSATVSNATCDPEMDEDCLGVAYNWTVTDGSDSASLSSSDTDSTRLTASAPGNITVRLAVTDLDDNEISVDTLTVEVEECRDLQVDILSNGSGLAGCDAEGTLNQPTLLRSAVSNFVGSLEFQWTVEADTGEFDDATAQDVQYTPLRQDPTPVRLTVIDQATGRVGSAIEVVCASSFTIGITGPQEGCGSSANPCLVQNNASGMFEVALSSEAPDVIDYAWGVQGEEDPDGCTFFELDDQDLSVIVGNCNDAETSVLISGNGTFVLELVAEDANDEDNAASTSVVIEGFCVEADLPTAVGEVVTPNGTGETVVAAEGEFITLSCLVDSLVEGDREIAWQRLDDVAVDLDDFSNPDEEGRDADEDGVSDRNDLCPGTQVLNPGCTPDLGDCRFLECDTDSDCDDGLLCNGLEVCVDRLCEAGDELCPSQICDESSGQCEPCFSDGQCDDGDLCTLDDCSAGVCLNLATECPDGQACNPQTGGCSDAECAIPFDCNDDDPCTIDVCLDGRCDNTAIGCPTDALGCTGTQIVDPANFKFDSEFSMPEAPSDVVLPPLSFECQAANPSTRCDVISEEVHVYFDVDPEVQPTAATEDQTVNFGDDVAVSCESVSGSEATTFEWRQVLGTDVPLIVDSAGDLTFTAGDTAETLQFECRGVVRIGNINLLTGDFNTEQRATIVVEE